MVAQAVNSKRQPMEIANLMNVSSTVWGALSKPESLPEKTRAF